MSSVLRIGAAGVPLHRELGIRAVVGVRAQANLLRPPGHRISLEERILVAVAHAGALHAQRQREAVGQIDVRQHAVGAPGVPAAAQLLLQRTILGCAQHARSVLRRGGKRGRNQKRSQQLIHSRQYVLGYGRPDWRLVLDLLKSGRVDPRPMITDIVALDALPAAFEALRKPTTQIKVMVRPND